MKIGLAVGGGLGDVARLAARAEEAGIESVWVAELDRTAFVQAAAAISATHSIGVGTAVALAFPRSPTITAMTAWDLDELANGRFMLGLGPQVKRVMESRFSVPFDRPAARLAEYATALRTVWAANRGESVVHEGEFYRITMPTFHGQPRDRRDVPVLLAAVGPVMSRVAGRVADGVIGHPMASPRYLAEAVAPEISAGLAEAGRASGAVPISATVMVSVGDDPDAARRAARLQIAFYATTPPYRPILALHDRDGVYPEIRRAFVRQDRDRMAELIDDELLDSVAIAGRPDEALNRLRRWEPVAERAIVSVPWYGAAAGQERELVEAALDLARNAVSNEKKASIETTAG